MGQGVFYMRKVLLLLMAIFIMGNVCYAEQLDQEKIGVVVIPARLYRVNDQLLNQIQTSVYNQFNPQKYDVAIFGKTSTPPFSDFLERLKSDNTNNNQSFLLKKETAVKYGKDIQADKLICILITPEDANFSVGLFSAHWKFNSQMSIKAFDVNKSEYIFENTLITDKKTNEKEGLNLLLEKFDKLTIPISLKTLTH